MRFRRQTQVNNRQHHENKGLQRHDQYVENGPAEMQGQLPQTEQRNQDENEFAGEHVAGTEFVLGPLMVDTVKVPVSIGGGFCDGRGLVAALAWWDQIRHGPPDLSTWWEEKTDD